MFNQFCFYFKRRTPDAPDFQHIVVSAAVVVISVFILVIGTFGIWMWQGYDSGVAEYGTSLHWSFFVIYGLAFIYQSALYEENGLKGSLNLLATASFTVLGVAVFEWFWMISYAVFHGEWWILTDNPLVPPNIYMTLNGLMWLPYIYAQGYKPAIYKHTQYSLTAVTLTTLLWYATGFTQTSYPQHQTPNIYIENNLIHTINLLSKASWAWLIATLTTLKNI